MRHPTSTLPFSKPCDLLKDAAELAPYYESLERFPEVMQGQQPVRLWEYAMALRTLQGWADRTGQAYVEEDGPKPAVGSIHPLQICDVGGAGGFYQILSTLTREPITVIDPVIDGLTVEQRAATYAHGVFDSIVSISVIEHVKDVRPFLRACHMLLKPGGLLFLTTDYWDLDGPDVAHFHWMRERIYNPESIRALRKGMREVGFQAFGESDWTYAGPQVYGYSVASVAVTKKGTR